MKLQPCVTQLEIFQILVTHLNAKNGHLCFDSFTHMGIVSRLPSSGYEMQTDKCS
jgi:hypothetical protein